MARKAFDMLTLTAGFICLLIGTVFTLRINITPNDVVYELKNNDVSISCEVENSDSNVREIMLLELSKEGVPIALLRENTALSIEQRITSKFQGEGRIYTSVNSSYIRVTLSNPDLDDAGAYNCQMFYLDQLHVLQDKKISSHLSVSYVRSVLKHLENEVSCLKNQLGVQKGLISQLQRQANVNEQSLRQTQDKVSFTAAFSIVNHNQTAYSQGETVLFRESVLNSGSNYDMNTGVFTAPRKGLYFFQMSMLEFNRGSAGTDVRLVGGSGPWEGRVEIRRNGSPFGTVCHYGWDNNDAIVICRMLGYTGGTACRSDHYGQGTGSIWLNDVNCGGSESDVFLCSHPGWGINYCGHYTDAGVACQHTTHVNKGSTTINQGDFYLKVNGMIVELAYVYNQSSRQGGSLSTVTFLSPGDEVKIVAETESDLDIGQMYLQFNGYILKLL